MHPTALTSKPLADIAAKYGVDRIARLSRSSPVPMRRCLRFTRTAAPATLLAPAQRPSARVLAEDPRSSTHYPERT